MGVVKVFKRVPLWVRATAIALLAFSVACQGYTADSSQSNTAPTSMAQPTRSQSGVSQPTSASSSPIAPQGKPADQTASNAALVDLRSISPAIRLDLRYATANNFMHRPLYNQSRCLLRAIAAEQLAAVQKDLEADGLGLKVYDCYRPLSVQKEMWKLFPDANYVANPARGSRHNRGSAVDVTLVDRTGKELTMPTDFDDFTDRAATNYDGASSLAKQNRQRLKNAMTKHGFTPLQTEWWHFDAASWAQFPVLDIPLEAVL